jgi:hypothetical protein
VKLFASASTVLVLAVAAAGSALAQAKPAVNSDAQLLADFKARVDKYEEMRKKADDSVPPLKKTDDAAKIKDAQQGLGERIGAARAGAKQGDVFTPEISALIRRLVHPETKDPDTKALLKEKKDQPKPWECAAVESRDAISGEGTARHDAARRA